MHLMYIEALEFREDGCAAAARKATSMSGGLTDRTKQWNAMSWRAIPGSAQSSLHQPMQ